MESAIQRVIRVSKEKLQQEVLGLLSTDGIAEEYMKLGRIQAIAECVRFAMTCKKQEDTHAQ